MPSSVSAVRPHVALEDGRGEARVGDQPFLGRLSHKNLAVVVEADDARREPRAEHVLDETRRAVAKHSDEAVGRAEVDSDNGQCSRPARPPRVPCRPSQVSRPEDIAKAAVKRSAASDLL